MKASALFPALNGGELSPLLIARVDLQKFGIACRTLTNFLPLPEGPIARRPGFQHLGSTKHLNQRSWLVPFVFGRRDAWLLELSDEIMRFWRQGGRVLDGASAYEIATPWTAAHLLNEAGGLNLTTAQARDRLWLASGKVAPYLLERRGATDWTLSRFDPEDGPFEPENKDDAQTFYVTGDATVGSAVTVIKAGGSALMVLPRVDGTYDTLLRLFRGPGSVVRPWEPGIAITANDVRRSDGKFYRAVNGATTGGIRPVHTEGRAFDRATGGVEWEYLHAGYGVVRITGVDANGNFTGEVVSRLPAEVIGSSNATPRWQTASWAPPVAELDLNEVDYPNVNPNTDHSLALKNVSGGDPIAVGMRIEIQWMETQGGYPDFGGVGDLLRIDYATGSAVVLITTGPLAFGEKRGVVLQLPPDGSIGFQPAELTWHNTWRTGPRPDLVSHPEAVGFAFGRLVFGRGNRLWFSRTDDFFSFADRSFGEVLADDALTLTLTGPKITAIHWLHETSAGLVVGTDGGEYLVTKANGSEVFGAVTDATRNAEAVQHTAFGSAPVRPVIAHGKALMIDASRRRLRELELRLETGRLSGLDLSAMASHILGSGVTWQAWQGAPDNTLWLGLADGSLASCAYLPEQEIVAFARHQLAGTAAGAAVVEHGETIPADDGKSTELWLTVRRTVNGITGRDVERLAPAWQHGTGQGPADSRHLDAWLSRDGTSATVISGLGHLRGEVVHGLADGFAVGPLTVSSGGSVTLPFAASAVVLGLRYRSEVALLVPDSGGIDGPGTHKLRRARRLLATLIESGDEFEAGTLATLRKISERSAQLPVYQVPPLVSRDARVPLDLGREYRPDVRLAAETALPFTLAAVMQRLEVAE